VKELKDTIDESKVQKSMERLIETASNIFGENIKFLTNTIG
jgi:hypothetical protein